MKVRVKASEPLPKTCVQTLKIDGGLWSVVIEFPEDVPPATWAEGEARTLVDVPYLPRTSVLTRGPHEIGVIVWENP